MTLLQILSKNENDTLIRGLRAPLTPIGISKGNWDDALKLFEAPTPENIAAFYEHNRQYSFVAVGEPNSLAYSPAKPGSIVQLWRPSGESSAINVEQKTLLESEGVLLLADDNGFIVCAGAPTQALVIYPGSNAFPPEFILICNTPVNSEDYRDFAKFDAHISDSTKHFSYNGKTLANIMYFSATTPSVFSKVVLSVKDATTLFQMLGCVSGQDNGDLDKLILRNSPENLRRIATLLPEADTARYYNSPLFPLQQYVHIADHGLTASSVRSSTEDFGPLYNERDSQGFLIPGTYSGRPSLEDGFGAFLGLQGLPNGMIDLHFSAPVQGQGALVFKEDIDTIFALVFGARDIALPVFSLDLENEVGLSGEPVPSTLALKQFQPEWLEHTLFGKTLYATDFWIGKIAHSPGNFLKPGVGTSGFAAVAKELLERLRSDEPVAESFRIVPREIKWAWDEQDGAIRCRVQEVSMFLYGARDEDDRSVTGKEVLSANNPKTRPGRVGNFVTERYDDFAQCWPIYERLRQLTALLFTTVELRRRGFKPSPQLSKDITTNLETLTRLKPKSAKERLVAWHFQPGRLAL